jgi:hypothetical protein
MALAAEPVAIIGTVEHAATVQVAAPAAVPSRILIQVAASPRPPGSGAFVSAIEALFGLEPG